MTIIQSKCNFYILFIRYCAGYSIIFSFTLLYSAFTLSNTHWIAISKTTVLITNIRRSQIIIYYFNVRWLLFQIETIIKNKTMHEWTRNHYNLIDCFGNLIFINLKNETQYPLCCCCSLVELSQTLCYSLG